MTSQARLALRPVPASAADARAFVDRTLGEWGCDELLDAARLLVSELVTNAVLHARTEIELLLHARGTGVRIAVRDRSPATPVVRHYEDEAMTGRGLALVEELAAQWGVDAHEDGKTVWFELDEQPPRR
ncbi:MAG TPA: ATP-binding protein [Mycobacteriales bacterium]|jgi:anti-sigma regulatory factor (Ser/Thr protein kinase)|nr:ATP-binding protein [Mycobacteriales bacterium]